MSVCPTFKVFGKFLSRCDNIKRFRVWEDEQH